MEFHGNSMNFNGATAVLIHDGKCEQCRLVKRYFGFACMRNSRVPTYCGGPNSVRSAKKSRGHGGLPFAISSTVHNLQLIKI